jgi:hypothetical protein
LVGAPSSIADLAQNNKVKQRRYYGPDGKAMKDIDATDHGKPRRHPVGGHAHDYDFDLTAPHKAPRELTKREGDENSDIL